MLFRSDYADRSIFLPASGYGYDSGLRGPGSSGYYWSSTPISEHSNFAWYLYFSSDSFYGSNNYRNYGFPVRPLRGFADLGGTVCSSASAPFDIDIGTSLVDPQPIFISYDASWIGGDTNATVVISDNGTEVRRTTGAGEFTYAPSIGRHELTCTTDRKSVV